MVALLTDWIRADAVSPRAWISFLAALGMALSVALCFVVRGMEDRQTEERANEVVRKQVEKLEVTILRSMEVLNGIASLHSARNGITEHEFREFVKAAIDRQPELHALSWNPYLKTGGESDPGKSPDDDSGRVSRRFRVPVQFIEPLSRNSGALGYDLISEDFRRESLERARDEGSPVATAPIHLAQEKEGSPGFLVLMPVYVGGKAVALQQRRMRIAGFAVAVFRLKDLVQSTMAELSVQGISAMLYDEGDRRHPIFDGTAGAGSRSGLTGHSSRTLSVAGRNWIITFAANGEFQASSHRQSWAVLFGGLAFTGLAVHHVRTGSRRLLQIAEANRALNDEVIERKKAQSAAAAANQAKSDFLASMSHEIRTPLNAILGHAQLLQRDPALTLDQQDAIAGIHVSGQHLLGLINEILDLAKIEAGGMELNCAPANLSALVRGLEATFRPLCARKRIAFHTDMETRVAATVCTDEGKLRQILINLLGNALKFTDSGGIRLVVRSPSNGVWHFEVADTGPGIPVEEQDEIFKPFHQGRGASRDGGTGLGLAIAKRQVELLGGRLSLFSEQGVGSIFYFALSLQEAQIDLATVQPRVRRLAAGSEIHALVVDDRKSNRDVLGGMLSSVGCRVSFACDGDSAVRSSLELEPDVVFMDLLMPDEGGAAAALRIRREFAHVSGRKPPVIIGHTAASLTRHLDEARESGCVECLPKPLEAGQVYAVLERHLGAVFDRVVEEQTVAVIPSVQGMKITLPEELSARLAVAAELHSTTALKSALKDLRSGGDDAKLLAEHIRYLMRSYDMDGIQKILASVVVADGARGGSGMSFKNERNCR